MEMRPGIGETVGYPGRASETGVLDMSTRESLRDLERDRADVASLRRQNFENTNTSCYFTVYAELIQFAKYRNRRGTRRTAAVRRRRRRRRKTGARGEDGVEGDRDNGRAAAFGPTLTFFGNKTQITWAEIYTHQKVRLLARRFARSNPHVDPDTCIRGRSCSLAHFATGPSRMAAEIWSPAGGFFADPKNWRRNTLVAAVGIATVAAVIFKKSTGLEERHALPNHRIPSQRFAPQSFPAAASK
jgi:hypothetical protein